MFELVYILLRFWFLYSLQEAQEVSRNLPGARGFIFPKYQPVPSPHDPIQVRNYLILTPPFLSIQSRVKPNWQIRKMLNLKMRVPTMLPIQTLTVERNLVNVFKNSQSIVTWAWTRIPIRPEHVHLQNLKSIHLGGKPNLRVRQYIFRKTDNI